MRWASLRHLNFPHKIQSFIIKTRFQSSILNPISQFNQNPRFFTSISSPDDLEFQVQNILDTYDFIEYPLEKIHPFLSHSVITSVLRDQKRNVGLGFRFFVWAMRRKSFRSWISHNLMIDMICEENGFVSAWESLELLRSCGIPIVSQAFTVLISAYLKSGMVEEAIESFSRMEEFSCKPETFTWNTVLHVLVKKEVHMLGLEVFNGMLKSDCRPNHATFCILLDGLFKAGMMKEALKLFDEMLLRGIFPNSSIYNIIISGLCQAKKTYEALELMEKMKMNSVTPDFFTYNALLTGFCKLGQVDEAIELLRMFRNNGFVLELYGYTCLIDGLIRVGRFDDAREWYRMMCEQNIVPDRVLYTIMIKGFMNVGKACDALKLLKEMAQRGIVPDTSCYNALIKGFCNMGLLDKARSLKLEMSKNDCFPDTATYTILIFSLCKKGLIREARQFFNEMEKHGCFPSIRIFNALIHGLFKAGEMEEAQLLFYKMEIGRNPSVFLRLSQSAESVNKSTSLQKRVEGLCESGLILKAYKLLRKLADCGVSPNIITYNILINGFCKANNINGAFKLFKELQLKGHSPDAFTYETLIDGLKRIGRDDDALAILNLMMRTGVTPMLTTYEKLIAWFCRKGKVTTAFNILSKYVKSLPDREEGAIKLVEENFECRDLEAGVRGLLEMDVKCKTFNPSPYNIWLNGLCQAGRLNEALKIFSLLEEFRIDITHPNCETLINGLCGEEKADLALDKTKHALDLVTRMTSAGYDLEVDLNQPTKALIRVCSQEHCTTTRCFSHVSNPLLSLHFRYRHFVNESDLAVSSIVGAAIGFHGFENVYGELKKVNIYSVDEDDLAVTSINGTIRFHSASANRPWLNFRSLFFRPIPTTVLAPRAQSATPVKLRDTKFHFSI
ncbi:hypothetical protein GIB67_002850 [Kingdonia uniflora]|uniref:Pentatricopeptide repeat-containing protein n=1 Tax=Kingdonia uniflora TaxID=39325 RepID=A0A7J7M5L8_9MAGN|nr:hypothetical protein GIB67_002850 [Kingdonia uniflora]